MGIIYLLTSPSGKRYIGQTRYNLKHRWREHLYDAFDPKKNHCIALNNALRKYGRHAFASTVLLECNDTQLDHFEEAIIQAYQSSKPAFGYNIKPGGSSTKHSEATKLKISKSLKGRQVSQETREKISRSRKRNPSLPMYLIRCRHGYRVCNHPKGPERRFVSKKQSLDTKRQLAQAYLVQLDALTQRLPDKPRLPRYIQRYKHGFCVDVPGMKKRYFVSRTRCRSELLQQAVTHKQNHFL